MHGLVAHLASMGVDMVSIMAIESTTKEAPTMTHPTQTKPNQTTSQADELTNQERVEAARRHVQQLQAFYIHAGVFAAGMLTIFVVNLATNISTGIAGGWSHGGQSGPSSAGAVESPFMDSSFV